MKHPLLALLIAAVLLAGCSVDQRREVGRYRSVVEIEAPAPEHRPGEPLSLAMAARLTNAVNERLSIEGEAYLQALIDRQRAASALMPTLDLFGNLTVREKAGGSPGDNPDAPGGGGGSQSETTLFDGGLRAQYTLLTGLTDFNRVRAADLTAEQRRWLLLDLRESLLLETARAYYAVLIAERQVAVLESSVAVQEARLRDILGRQRVGFARPLDVAQIEAQASQTRVALLDARNQAATSRAALSLLTGIDASSIELTDGFEPAHEQIDGGALAALAARHRADLHAALLAAQAARATVDAEIGRYYPTVSLNLDYFLTRDSTPTDRDWTSLLSISLPLFSAGRIDADVRTAWSRFRQAVLNHSLVRRQIERDLAVALADLYATRLRVAELSYQVRAAQEALRQAEAAYHAGLGTNLERITAQDQVLTAEVGLVREQFSEKIAALAAARAAGVLTSAVTGLPIELPPAPEPAGPPDSPFVIRPAPGASPTALPTPSSPPADG